MLRAASHAAAEFFRAHPRPAITTWVSLSESYALRQAAEGRQVLEVGSQWGYSTVLMAQAGAHVVAVDPHAEFGSWPLFLANLERYGVRDRVEPMRDYSQRILPGLEAGSFDLAFIDGDHSEEVAGFDLGEALRLVRPGGTIAVHDYSAVWPGVKAAVDRALGGLERRRVESLILAVTRKS